MRKPNRTSAGWTMSFVALVMLVSQARTAVGQTEVAIDTTSSITSILERYAIDYQADPSLSQDITFGVEVGGTMWHFVTQAANEADPATVTLVAGAPQEPSFYYTLDFPTLQKLDSGLWNAKTAMAGASPSDPRPMRISGMDGFTPPEGFTELVLKTTFYFWTRGLPEIIPFNDAHTRFTHGADAAIFYYQPGMRSGWVSVKPGQHANKNPDDQTNLFPSMLIITSGRGHARIGDKQVILSEGQAVFIPAGVSHEFWNHYDRPMEAILLMFGEGA